MTTSTTGTRAPGRPARTRVAWSVLGLVLVVAIAAAGGITIDDARTHAAIVVAQSTFPNATDTGEVEALKRAALGETVTAADLDDALAFVRSESDGSDFRLITLLRLLLGYGDRLEPAAEATLRDVLTGVPWWMDDPGTGALVYWSENHQALFATEEYLAGSRYPTDRFRDGRTGADRAADALDRLAFWLDQRWRYGFSEWNSHYYAEDAAALAGLIDFAPDEAIRRQATIVMDRLMLDIASHTVRGEFIASSGRLYEANRTTGDEAIRRIVRAELLGDDETSASTSIDINVLLSGYRTPPAIAAIAAGTSAVTITQTYGRDPGDIAADPELGSPEQRIMALWGAEAFTNPESVEASLDWIRAHGLLVNPYLAPLRQLDWRVLRAVGGLPLLSRALDLPSNGIALARADVHAYRTADLLPSTTQAYRPGGYGNQEAIVQLTLDPGMSIFHNHPAVRVGDPSPNGSSPGYWTGDGTLPAACADGPVSLAVYDLPEGPGFGRSEVLGFTHLRVPLAAFDEVALDGPRLVMRYGSALVAVTGSSPLRRAGEDELVQDGRRTAWAIEVSSTRDETLEAFAARIGAAQLGLDGRAATYASGAKTVTASVDDGCLVDGSPITVPYPRVPTPWASLDAGGRGMTVEAGGHRLVVNAETGERTSE